MATEYFDKQYLPKKYDSYICIYIIIINLGGHSVSHGINNKLEWFVTHRNHCKVIINLEALERKFIFNWWALFSAALVRKHIWMYICMYAHNINNTNLLCEDAITTRCHLPFSPWSWIPEPGDSDCYLYKFEFSYKFQHMKRIKDLTAHICKCVVYCSIAATNSINKCGKCYKQIHVYPYCT